MVIVKVWLNKNGQAFLTIPKALFDALGWDKGTKVEFEIMGKDKIKIERIKNSPRKKTGEVINQHDGGFKI